jgi:hypothetical protein
MSFYMRSIYVGLVVIREVSRLTESKPTELATKSNRGLWVILGMVAVWGVSQYMKIRDQLNIEFKDVGFNGQYIATKFLVTNPSDIGGTINNISGQLSFKGSPIANVSTSQQYFVPAHLPFEISLLLDPIGGNIFQSFLLALKGFNPSDLRFDGYVNFNGLNIPVKTNFG